MIPIRLTIKGFLSYQQVVELDFTGFELACISGPNGAGKSSLLDAITWALFGRARKKEDDALINSDCQSAEITLEFTYERDQYRIRRSKVRNKTCQLELFILNQQKEWVNLSEHSLRETEKRIEQTLRMDYETFINTCFFLQGKADQFAQQPAGKRKEILSSILNLEIWEEYRKMAALLGRREENEINATNALLGEIEAELAQEGERRTRLERTSHELELKSNLRREKEQLADSTRRQADLLKEQENSLNLLRSHLVELDRQKQENQSIWQSRSEELKFFTRLISDEKNILDGYQNLRNLRMELQKQNLLATQFHSLDQQRAGQEAILAAEKARLEQVIKNLKQEQEKMDGLQIRLNQFNPQLETAAAEIKAAEEKLTEKAAMENQIQNLQQSQSEMTAGNKQLRASMDELKSRIEKLNAARATCPLCGSDLSEHHRASLLAGLEKEGKNQADQYRLNEKNNQDISAQVTELRKKLSELAKIEIKREQFIKTRAGLETEIRSATQEIESWTRTGQAALAESQKNFEEGLFAADAQKELGVILASISELDYDRQAHADLEQKELDARECEELHQALEKARASAQPLQREIGLIEQRQAELDERLRQQEAILRKNEEKQSQASAALPNLLQMEAELSVIQSEENELRMEAGRALQEVEVLTQRKSKKDELLAKREAKARSISQLERLERAFGRNGVPALLIEQALPDIESKANQILDQLSSGGMSLTFATERERKNKKEDGAIQTLDILISDAAGKREYELFSGGEAFRINFAIRLALSQALAKRAGARLQTLVIDEGFGSQDADGRQRLIEAINLVMESGTLAGQKEPVSDIRKILVITHLDELKDAFPARIEVEKTTRGSALQVMS
jgi:DNA repair protein SbcC/Rad50